MSLTTDPEEARRSPIRPDGMQETYLVLSEEERAKGFVAPVRRSYIHVGRRPQYPLRDLTAREHERYAGEKYVKYEAYPTLPGGGAVTGRFWTQADLESGCGSITTMGQALAETYARNPSFYGATFCVGCGAHFPVGEHGQFVWDGTNEKVGTLAPSPGNEPVPAAQEPECGFIDERGLRCGHIEGDHVTDSDGPTWCRECQQIPDPRGPRFYHDFTPAAPPAQEEGQ